jgi:hypothetical protein
VGVVSNSWTATPPNGRSEWLSSIRLGSTYYRSYNINVSGVTVNSDFIFQPYVSYSLTAGFTPSSCNAGGNTISFANTSSPVLLNPFYSVRAFQGIPQFSCLWDYGDTTGTWYQVNGSHIYNYRIPYSVKLRDTLYGWMTGCGDQASLSVNASPAPTIAHNNGPLCNGATLRLSADTVTGANYYWTGPNGFTSALQNPSVGGANVSMIGNYNVRVIIGQCSSMVATTYVNVISTPSATNNGPICAGQTLNLSVTNITGATYSWTGPNSFTSSSQSPVKAGTTVADSGIYSVTVTLSGCGTIGPYTTTAVVNRVPGTPTVTNNGPLCVGDNLNLTSTAYAGGTYSWTGPNGFTSNQQNPSRPVAQNSFAGTYTVTIAANGCTSSPGSTTVTVNNVPAAPTAGNNGPLCSAQTLSLTATTIASATYSWSGPNGFSSSLQNPTRSSLTTADAGNYSVVATVNGCSSVAGVTAVAITTLTPTPVAGSNGPLCPGQNLQLTASTIPGATYSWTGPNSFTSTQQNPTINGVSGSNGGIYTVTASTSGCGTSSGGNVNVTINSLPAAPTAGNNGPICNGDSLQLSASSITGATYYWSGPGGFSSSQQNPVIPNMSSSKSGIYNVYVTVTGCGTSSTSTTNVINHAIPPTPTATTNAPVCSGDTLTLVATAFAVGPNAVYSWTGPNSFNSTLKDPVLFNANSANVGTYSLTVSDSGCTSNTATVLVNVRNVPATPVPSSNAPICEGANLLLSSTAVSGATYMWKGPGGFTSSAQNPLISNSSSALNSGTYTVSAIVNGCVSVPATLTVLVNPLPATPVATNNSPKCVGDNVTLSASLVSGAVYSWTGPNGYTSNQQNPLIFGITQAMAGIYNVIAISSTCSSSSASTAVVVNPYPAAPTLSSNPSTGTTCSGDSVQFFANYVNGATYDWTGPAGFGVSVQNPVIRNLATVNSGTYYATITKGGCTSPQTSISLTVNESPATGSIIGATTVRNYDVQSYTVSGSPGSVFNWIAFGGTIQSGGTTNLISVQWGTPSTSAFVRMRETNTSGCKGPTQQLNVTVVSTQGIEESTLQAGNISVYPNPANRTVNIDFDLTQAADSKVDILDMLGQTVMSSTVRAVKKDQIPLDISALNAGIYFVNITIGNETKMIKLAVKN